MITFEAVPGADGVPLAQRLRHALETIASHVRPSDVVARLHDDTVALLLVETDGPGAHDALFRVRATLAGSGRWEIVSYAYPADAETIATIAA